MTEGELAPYGQGFLEELCPLLGVPTHRLGETQREC